MSEYIVDIPESYPFKIVKDGWHYHVECEYQQREEIVRCRDCRHFKKGEEEPPVDWCCYFHDEVTPLGFCAWGERSEE